MSPARGKGRAVVTGASSGIGEVYARALAARGYDLLITARREARLRELAEELGAAFKVDVRVEAADLAVEADRDRLAALIRAMDDITLLVNNAGYGVGGKFVESDIRKAAGMVVVHDIATIVLCHAVLPGMIARQHGGIINVSSISAFLKGTTYSASKAFLNAFSTGLHAEVRRHGIKVQALCPGYTYSEFHNTPEYADFSRDQIPRRMWMTAEEVVTFSLAHLGRRPVVIIPGWRNKLLVWSMQLGLRPVVRALRDFLYRRR
ncbi:MAG: SDR family NAD(P)-dependent oxidoreductase [Chloroflexota bacterium]